MGTRTQIVQSGVPTLVLMDLTFGPSQVGLPGAIRMVGLSLSLINDELVDLLEVESIELTSFAEQAVVVNPGVDQVVQAAPAFIEAGGPDDENVYRVQVLNADLFEAGQLVRRQASWAQVYQILAIPDSTHLDLWAASGDLDIENQDTLQLVEGTGTYVARLTIDFDQYIDVATPQATLHMIAQALSTADREPGDPAFNAGSQEAVTVLLTLDLGAMTATLG